MSEQQIHLTSGKHTSPEDGMCLVEARQFVIKGPWTDSPEDLCPAVASFARAVNDACPNDCRDELFLPLVSLLEKCGQSSRALRERRGFRCADWAVREVLPLLLDKLGQSERAAELRKLEPIVDSGTAAFASAAAASSANAAFAAARAARAARAAYATASAASAAAAAYAAAAFASAAAFAAAAAADAISAARAAASAAASAAHAAAYAAAYAECKVFSERSAALLRELTEMQEPGEAA